jgi:hypothetical protein
MRGTAKWRVNSTDIDRVTGNDTTITIEYAILAPPLHRFSIIKRKNDHSIMQNVMAHKDTANIWYNTMVFKMSEKK